MFTALAIIERAYRGSVEIQFADVLYKAREFNRQLGRLDVALRGLAVTYAVEGQFDPSLHLGPRPLDALPDGRRSVKDMLDDGITVYANGPDLAALGVEQGRVIPGVRCDDTGDLARRWAQYDAVWFL